MGWPAEAVSVNLAGIVHDLGWQPKRDVGTHPISAAGT
jgi:hypothetical protein